MVATCFLLGIVVYGAGRYSFGVFMKPLADDMGWTRTEISLAGTINLVCYGISSPLIGWLMQRVGARRVMLSGAALLSASLCAMYFANSIWWLYFLFGFLSAIGGNAIGRISHATIVTNWFVRRRGLMMGITAVSVGLGTAIMAPFARFILDTYGWQVAFLVIGLIVALLGLLPIYLFILGRGGPEERGFGPDGASLDAGTESTTAVQGKPLPEDWSTRRALGSFAFWALSLSFGLSYAADFIILLHGPAHFEDMGFSGADAALMLSLGTLSSCVGRLGFGWLADRANQLVGFYILLGLQLLSVPLVMMSTGDVMLYAFAVVWGFGLGGVGVYYSFALASFFGRSHFSAIYGWATMLTVFCASVGGTAAGWIYDRDASYQNAWLLCAGFWIAAIVLVSLSFSSRAMNQRKSEAARPEPSVKTTC